MRRKGIPAIISDKKRNAVVPSREKEARQRDEPSEPLKVTAEGGVEAQRCIIREAVCARKADWTTPRDVQARETRASSRGRAKTCLQGLPIGSR